MKSSLLLVISAWAARCYGSDGFLIDNDLPDGNYRITLAKDETEEHVIKRWEPVVKRWKPIVKTLDHAAKNDSSSPSTLAKRKYRPHWVDHSNGVWHYMDQYPSDKDNWVDQTEPIQLPPHSPGAADAGTGQYSFLVDEDTAKLEDLSVDLIDKGRLPIPLLKTECVTDTKYPTLQYDLDPDDYRASKQALFNWCDTYRFRDEHVELALRGTVAVYVCQDSYTWSSFSYCSEAEYEAAETAFNTTCGNGPAWSLLDAYDKRYGRSWKGERICHGVRHVVYEHRFWPHHIDEDGTVSDHNQ